MGDHTLDGESGVTLAGDPAVSQGTGGAHQLPSGGHIGRYLILGPLGAGGMGEVYAAYDPELDRKVALKVLHAVGGKDRTLGAARLQREAQALARLSHPNVVTVHDVGTFEGRVFVAMEFVDGQTLGDWLKASPRTVREVVGALTDAGRGLAGAHAAGLVHRDFKPDNVMVRRDGRILVMDFGVARPTEEASGTDEEGGTMALPDAVTLELTAAGALVGTPAYMAPEQHLGAVVDARTDQFAFCVTLYEAAYGERPFAGDNLAALAFRVAQGDVRDPPTRTKVPARIRRVILRGLSNRRADRFASMDELLEALARASRGRARLALAVGAVAVLGGAIAVGPMLEQRQLAACKKTGEQIQESWNEDARDRVRSSLAAAGLPDARGAYFRLEYWLDEYAGEWAEVREEACVASQVRGDRSPVLVQASEECLVERADALAVLIERLSNADQDIAPRASEAAVNLPPISACASESRLMARPQLPSSEAAREQVRTARRALRDAQMMLLAGHHAQAKDAVEEIARIAQTIDHAPLSADVSLTLGLVLQRSGDFEPALAAYEDAFATALGVGSDESAAEAAHRLMFLTGVKLARYEEAARWERLGRELLHRLDAEEGLLANAVDHASGTVALVRGEYDHAQAMFESALAGAERILGPEHPVAANTLNTMGILALMRGEYQASLGYHNRALEIRRKSVGPDHPEVGQSYSNMGNVYYRLEDYERALESYQAGADISERLYGPDHPDVGLALNNIGNVRDDMGDHAGALEAYARALSIREATFGADHFAVAQVLHNMGIVERRLEHFERSQGLLERALEIKQKTSKPTNPSLVQTRVELASTYLKLGDHEAAREQAQEAVRASEEETSDVTNLPVARFALARALRARDPADAAIRPLAQKALDGIPEGTGTQFRVDVESFLASLVE